MPTSSLPRDFTALSDLENSKINKLYNVVGFVFDFKEAIRAKNDFKKLIQLAEKPMRGFRYDFHIFRSEKELPEVKRGDVMVIYNAKLQLHNGMLSLLSNYETSVFVYNSSKITRSPRSIQGALQTPVLVSGRTYDPQFSYIWEFFHSVHKDDGQEAVATPEPYRLRSDKFCLLKDATNGRFHDIIVRAVHRRRRPDGLPSLLVTDYTENDRFRDPTQYGDVGETKSKQKGHSALVPEGHSTMEVIFYEDTAHHIKDVKIPQWLKLKNVHFQEYRMQYLEGKMHLDREYPNRDRVIFLKNSVNSAGGKDSEHLKQAILRMNSYEKRLLAAPQKRKAEFENAKTKRKQKRANEFRKRDDQQEGQEGQEQRQQEQQEQQKDCESAKAIESLVTSPINQYIVSEHSDQMITPLAKILQPVHWTDDNIDGGVNAGVGNSEDERTATTTCVLPFVNNKFRAQVRVVDFWPERLQDFSVCQQTNRPELSSDYEEDGIYDDSYEEADGSAWEWRFALLLEDATENQIGVDGEVAKEISLGHKQAPARIWAIVSNREAQLLLADLDNACDLRSETGVLDRLRETLFVLWGDLEEKKMILLQERSRQLENDKQKLNRRQDEQEKRRIAARTSLKDYPAPPDSSDVEGASSEKAPRKKMRHGRNLEEKEILGTEENGERAASPDQPRTVIITPFSPRSTSCLPSSPLVLPQVRNRPFVCCIQQYGVCENAQTESGCNPMASKWERVFSLFGTKIRSLQTEHSASDEKNM